MPHGRQRTATCARQRGMISAMGNVTHSCVPSTPSTHVTQRRFTHSLTHPPAHHSHTRTHSAHSPSKRTIALELEPPVAPVLDVLSALEQPPLLHDRGFQRHRRHTVTNSSQCTRKNSGRCRLTLFFQTHSAVPGASALLMMMSVAQIGSGQNLRSVVDKWALAEARVR